ncbi:MULTISPECIES: bifunctional 2-polyprenyl-6-hydroxyphenol methylase/3-demethylubiquinol 3-O-methyltransferase UbiG [unclassified Streptomyces]|uniref:class I SAM-dependent methyltransferase n=1 Tax=unclassified Streptomyces TaxID=2593676 RepID=UPI000CD5410E|nr:MULTISPECIES: class I SAM-dependent methyltransferase [unclassified Streptomyces]
MPARHNHDDERDLWDSYASSVTREIGAPVMNWTQYAGHGPGADLLGSPARVLEIGCGTGRTLAYLADRGVRATGVDMSPVMVDAVRERWGERVTVHCAEVLDFLRGHDDQYDAVYSIFGAVWFCDPGKLLPLVVKTLGPGGRLVFSHPPAIPGAYGPQGMYKGGFAGRAQFTYRYGYTPRKWESLLLRAGFSEAEVRVLDAPEPGHIGTLIARAVVS